MKRVLADVDAHRGNGQTRYVGHGDAPLLLAPFKHHSLEWREHGRTIRLAEEVGPALPVRVDALVS